MCLILEHAKARRRIIELEAKVSDLEKQIAEIGSGGSPTVDVPSPRDIISKDSIRYLSSERKIEIRNVNPEIWITGVQDTNSMDPVMDYGHTTILTNAFKPEDLRVGDVVVYEAMGMNIIHRIIAIETDEQGRLFTLKGDNNQSVDPFQVRDNMIKWLLLAVIY